MTVGDELGPSSWIDVPQARIAAFAEATEDRQRIHLDAARAAQSAFGTTVAHGFLTLSLVAPAVFELVPTRGDVVNYGLNRVRFPAPVPAGSRIRTRLRVDAVEAVAGGEQVTFGVTVEREGGGDRPVCVAELIFRYLA